VEQWSLQGNGSVEIICLGPAPASSSNNYSWSLGFVNIAAGFDNLFITYQPLIYAGIIFRKIKEMVPARIFQDPSALSSVGRVIRHSICRTSALTEPGGIVAVNHSLLISVQDTATLLITNSANIIKELTGETTLHTCL